VLASGPAPGYLSPAMTRTNLSTRPAQAPETEAETQRRLGSEADAVDTAVGERRRQRTLRALADVDAGRLIDDAAMQAWADSLGTDHELPAPQPD
jgi:predicted transcriptional regulator